MAVQYTNRIGKTYYLREGKTKTGKPRYFFSTQQEEKGATLEHVPDGYEIYEHPQNAQIFLRKKRPQLITDIEKYLVEKYAKTLADARRYRVDCKDECITIYESDVNAEEVKGIFGKFLKDAPLRTGVTVDDTLNTFVSSIDRNYSAMLRFRLMDEERRTFTAERFCFRGSIDDWIFLGGPSDLKTLIERYMKLLGTEEFFDSPFF